VARAYEDRLIAYVDILGWEDASNRLPPEKLVEAVSVIHDVAHDFNEQERERLIKLHDPPRVSINQGYLRIRAAAFSDNIAISEPKAFGTSIFSIRKICLHLLQLGFLTRGAVCVGQLYHEDNMIFGPALNRAHAIEVREAVFPRIVVDNPVVMLLRNHPEFELEVIQDDVDKKYIVNLYRPAFREAPAEIWRSVLDTYYKFPETLEVIRDNLNRFANDNRKLAKWKYIKNYVKKGKRRLFDFIGTDLPKSE